MENNNGQTTQIVSAGKDFDDMEVIQTDHSGAVGQNLTKNSIFDQTFYF